MRMVEHDIGDLDAAEQQRQETDMGDQPVGRERRRLAVAKDHVAEADGAGREQRDLDRSADDGLDARGGTDLRRHGVARARGRDQPRRRPQAHRGGHDHDAGGDSKTLQASGRGHRRGIRI
jgi:hypothetical protein